MSQWKKLLGDLNKDTQSAYSARPKKYTPRKRPYDEHSPSRFHNQTIQKINMSGLSQQKSLGRSFIGRQNEPENQVKKMKASSSQVRLHKDPLGDKKNALLSLESLGLHQLDRTSLEVRKQPLMGKMERSLIYEQVQKIKKQFGIFQSIVLKELQRQERLINSMFEEIIDKIKEQNQYAQRNYDLLANLKQNNKQEQVCKDHECMKAYSQVVNKKPFQLEKQNEVKEPPREKSLPSQNYEKNSYPFQRFFEAMQNLKKNFNELNLISDMPSVTSPKSGNRPLTIEEMGKLKNHLK